MALFPTRVYLNCDCPFLGGLCTKEPPYDSGGAWYKHCLGNPPTQIA
jgi:hypothetical protein